MGRTDARPVTNSAWFSPLALHEFVIPPRIALDFMRPLGLARYDP